MDTDATVTLTKLVTLNIGITLTGLIITAAVGLAIIREIRRGDEIQRDIAHAIRDVAAMTREVLRRIE
ncbi:MAG: hypothetical protein ONB06_04730 [candidate division KSB1 bacterium]|nr:hypothetical protein [candidate division KSB1 bacterium]